MALHADISRADPLAPGVALDNRKSLAQALAMSRIVLAVVALFTAAFVYGGKGAPPPPTEGGVVTLETFKIKAMATSNFTIGIQIYVYPATKKVGMILISWVADGSDAEKKGLKVGDKIVAINGTPVNGMDSEVSRDSQIGRLFLNRAPNAPLDLEVEMHRTEQVTLHAVVGQPTEP
ncbi:MAG TPA: PDZ domain-containing protein [Candidatus Didemnitutus sp.]